MHEKRGKYIKISLINNLLVTPFYMPRLSQFTKIYCGIVTFLYGFAEIVK